MDTLVISTVQGACLKKKNKTKYKWYVGTWAVSAAPTLYIECVWYVGPLCSQHWSTSLPGHTMQHDPSSNQPVIDPVVLLWIPMAHQLYMYVSVSSTSSFGWASSSTPHLANLYITFGMYPKAIVMGRVLSLYLHASIFTLVSPHLAQFLFIYFSLYRLQHLSNAWSNLSPFGQASFRLQHWVRPVIK